MKTFSAEPDRFVRDLNTVSATLSPSLRVAGFLDDLDRVHSYSVAVHESAVHVTTDDLTELALKFDKIWAGAHEKLGGEKWWENLPAYHPLRCQVGLFGTLDLGLHETAHTRTLAWLMDPDREHGFGDALLRALLERIFGIREEFQLSNVSVTSELLRPDRRDRLDIVMRGAWTSTGQNSKTERWAVVVEAKIGAEEGEGQLARYEVQDASADRRKLVFLTPDGREPETGSGGRAAKWISVSFKDLMVIFQQRMPAIIGKPGFDFLRLYMTGVLKDFYQLTGGESIGERGDVYRIRDYLSLANKGDNKHG